jgi:hypothetical protein
MVTNLICWTFILGWIVKQFANFSGQPVHWQPHYGKIVTVDSFDKGTANPLNTITTSFVAEKLNKNILFKVLQS